MQLASSYIGTHTLFRNLFGIIGICIKYRIIGRSRINLACPIMHASRDVCITVTCISISLSL